MRAITGIFKRELGAFFNTAIGYVFVIFFLVLSCYLYVQDLFFYGLAEMRNFFNVMPFLLMIFLPAISMRFWSEERKLGTIELLLTFPVKTWQAVIGKFLAGMALLGITMVLTFHLPIALLLLSGDGPGPDFGVVAGGYLGTMVLGMIFLAVGTFASSITSDQIVSFIVGITINALLLLMGWPKTIVVVREFSEKLAELFQLFSIIPHFESISKGIVDTRDVVYALTMCAFFLFLNVLVLERRR